MKITAVDIDSAMLDVATEYFDLVQDERLDVYIRDGINFIHQAAEKGVIIKLYHISHIYTYIFTHPLDEGKKNIESL